MNMRRNGERGEGQLSGMIMLLLIVALAWAAWNVAPVYMDHYSFQDKINEICRTPRYKAPTDDKILDMLMKEVRERRLGDWIDRNSFRISTTDTSRRIILDYERPAKVLPGWERSFQFHTESDQPLI
jgi:hypothetical protein